MIRDVKFVICEFLNDFDLLVFALLCKEHYQIFKLMRRNINLIELLKTPKDISKEKIEFVLKFFKVQINKYCSINSILPIQMSEDRRMLKTIIKNFEIENKDVNMTRLQICNFTEKICKSLSDVKYLCDKVPDKYLDKDRIQKVKHKKIKKKKQYYISF